MKFQNIIRTQIVLAGLGAALLLPISAKSQEVENATFNDGPNVVAFAKSSPAQAPVAASTSPADVNAVQPIRVTSLATITEQAGFAQDQSSVNWQTPVLLICIGVLALYALVEAKRANRNLRSRGGQHSSEAGA